ncbi:hypothetical protein IWZ00DRAFT_565254 [Phyllosticta capitalensis]|uniref:uncharacterized protein n=1 Tax=Phyllosticta capitalensis TaxID=121624 RepID=UPI00312DFC0C
MAPLRSIISTLTLSPMVPRRPNGMMRFSTWEDPSPPRVFEWEEDASIEVMVFDEHGNDMGCGDGSGGEGTENDTKDEMMGVGLYADGGKVCYECADGLDGGQRLTWRLQGHSYCYCVKSKRYEGSSSTFPSSPPVLEDTQLHKAPVANRSTNTETSLATEMDEAATTSHRKMLRPPPTPRFSYAIPVPSSSPVITPLDHSYPFTGHVGPIYYMHEQDQETGYHRQRTTPQAPSSGNTAFETDSSSIYFIHERGQRTEHQTQHQQATHATHYCNTTMGASTSLIYGYSNTGLYCSPADASFHCGSTRRPRSNAIRSGTLSPYSTFSTSSVPYQHAMPLTPFSRTVHDFDTATSSTSCAREKLPQYQQTTSLSMISRNTTTGIPSSSYASSPYSITGQPSSSLVGASASTFSLPNSIGINSSTSSTGSIKRLKPIIKKSTSQPHAVKRVRFLLPP